MVKLREYDKADTDRLIQLANDRDVSQYLVDTFPYPYTLADAEWWIESGSRENGAETRVIEYRGEFVGSVGIMPQSGWRNHIAEIGYWLGKQYWGRGIATEALDLMTRTAFSEHVYAKLFAPVIAVNTASIRVLEKNGYILEGVLKNEVRKHGRYYDIRHYAKFAP